MPTTVGILVRFEVAWDREDEVARYFEELLPAALDESPAKEWLAMRFSATTFGVLVCYDSREGQHEHIGEQIVAALGDIRDSIDGTPAVAGFDLIAAKDRVGGL